MSRKIKIRSPKDSRIQRVLAVMDAWHEADGHVSGSFLYGAGHQIADNIFSDVIGTGDVTYAGMRAAVAEVMRHVSSECLDSIVDHAMQEQAGLQDFMDREKRIDGVAELLGIDRRAAEKLVDEHDEARRIGAQEKTAIAAEVH